MITVSRIFSKLLLGLTLTTTSLTIISAQEEESKPANEPIKIQRINSPVDLDGMSDESAWVGIKPFPVFMHVPNFGSEPSERTEILLGYDDDYLYATGRFYDREPSKIQVTSFKRDIFTATADAMNIVLDTYRDYENTVWFMTTAAGTRTDASIIRDAEGILQEEYTKVVNSSWNTFWDAAAVVNDDGWFAEMRIPFSSLRFEVRDGKTVMGLTTYRRIARKYEMDIFPLVPQKYRWPLLPSQTQDILFEDIKSHNPLYITPYLLGGIGQSNDLNGDGTAYERNEEFAREAGLDVKYGLTNCSRIQTYQSRKPLRLSIKCMKSLLHYQAIGSAQSS